MKIRSWLTFVALLLSVVAGDPSPVHAAGNEALCDTLGSSCICSEPFNTASFVGGPDFWNPADTTTKECSVEAGSPGGAIVRTSATIQDGSSDTNAMNALPAAHTNSHFVTAEADHEGTFMVGNGIPVSSTFVRLAARWYVWHTSDYTFKETEQSCNSKITEHNTDSGNPDNRVDYTAGFHIYNFLSASGWSPGVDCCTSGPGNDSLSGSQMVGKWYRWEIVVTNRAGPNVRIQFFAKNVTDNTAELTLIDTNLSSQVNNQTPPARISGLLANNHRFDPGGGPGCHGRRGLAYYMMAGWTTNAGQRIGAASEIEGGAGSPPSAPTGLTVTP